MCDIGRLARRIMRSAAEARRARSAARRLTAERYDSGMGTVDYTCDRCQARVQSMTLPPGWREDGAEHVCPAHGSPAADGGTACAICRTPMPEDFEAAMDAGWIPEFWIGDDDQRGPACGECDAKHLVPDTDGETVLRPESAHLAPTIL